MKHVFTSLILLITVASVHANPVILDCTAKQKILIVEELDMDYLKDYKNAPDEGFIVVIKDNEISLNDGNVFKVIPRKSKQNDGYDEHGHLKQTEFLYDGSRIYQKLEKSDENYFFLSQRLKLYRLSGDFFYHKIINLDNFNKKAYQKYNYKNLSNGYVFSEFEGTCKTSKLRQLF